MLPAESPVRVQASFEAMQVSFAYISKIQAVLAEASEEACQFFTGNPYEMALPGFVNALEKALPPQNSDWYAYTINEPTAVTTVARSLRSQFGMEFEAEDIFLTNGATGALDITLNALVEEGDEVIFISPPWFFYEAMIINNGGVPRRVKIDPVNFDLDLAAIESAIGARTRAIIVNSPNNPTGKIYPPKTLRGLAEILTHASQEIGRTIYIISDEAYRRVLFDGRSYHSPTAFYPNTLMVYTYGKTLLTPGQRLGYVALPPTMPNREQIRNSLFVTQIVGGFATANALIQHALADIEPLSIDVEHMQHKRDRMVSSLRSIGCEVHVPEATFYLMPKAPIADDLVFCDLLAAEEVFCLPGTIVEMPGYFRISLTANDEMIERALPRFARVYGQAKG